MNEKGNEVLCIYLFQLKIHFSSPTAHLHKDLFSAYLSKEEHFFTANNN